MMAATLARLRCGGLLFSTLKKTDFMPSKLLKQIRAERARETVIRQILAECTRQDEKWGEQNHAPMIWLGILAEEFGEAAKEANDWHFRPEPHHLQNLRTELIQTAAACLAFIESLDRNELGGGAHE